MTTPDLTLITGVIVAYLKTFADLAALTPRDGDGNELTDGLTPPSSKSAIVDVNAGDLQSLVEASVARCAVAVAVSLAGASEDGNQSNTPFYDKVRVEIEVYEVVELNKPASGGTGLAAWTIADRVAAALKLYRLTGLAAGDSYEVLIVPPGIADVTSKENVKEGVKVLRIHFQTKCQGVARPS